MTIEDQADTGSQTSTVEVLRLLARGGFVVTRSVAPGGDEVPAAALPRYDGLRDPTGAEQLGQWLAQQLRALEPTALLLWQGHQDIVLVYVLALSLDVPAIRSYDVDGLVQHDGRFPANARIVLVGDAFREASPVKALCALVEQQGGQVVGAGVLAAVPGSGADELAARQVPVTALVDLQREQPAGVGHG